MKKNTIILKNKDSILNSDNSNDQNFDVNRDAKELSYSDIEEEEKKVSPVAISSVSSKIVKKMTTHFQRET